MIGFIRFDANFPLAPANIRWLGARLRPSSASVFRIASFYAGLALRVSFCCYDAASVDEPVLATAASHPVIAFHRPHEWTLRRLE